MKQIAFKLEIFEGPLDLLLHLIHKNKVSIYDIPISEITEQYLNYMEEMQHYDIELSSEFLVLAANLLYIKSKMILPKAEEDEPEDDPRLELAERLILYKRMKMASDYLRQREYIGEMIYYKPRENITPIIIDESLKLVTIGDLKCSMETVYQNILRKKPLQVKSFSKIVGHEPIPVFSKVTAFINKFKEFKKILFEDLFKGIKSRDEAVASFLAILELMKMNTISVSDKNGDLELSYVKKEAGSARGTPRTK